MKHKSLVIFLSIIMFFVGAFAGVVGISYFNLPHHEELVTTNQVYYSLNEQSATHLASGVQPAQTGAVSVHFLELGNKYTGDCTYIKIGENIDILIDCGSKSNSVATVSNYLNQYVTDGSLEYVIVTHAHQDHYAGFATTEQVDSIFDLYECKNIIQFSQTNQKSTAKMYANYIRERDAEVDLGANLYTATDILNNFDNGTIVLDQANDISLQILNSYYYTNSAHTENDYSVCTLISQGDKNFLFTGDLEEDGEEYLTTLNNLPQVELYKAGHHGSKTSSTMTLLNKIQPKIVCVCCCAGSSEYTKNISNQFPTVEFINNISQFTTNVYVTTLSVDYANNIFTSFNGNIVVMSNKNQPTTSVYCSNNTLKLKDTDWFKQNRLQLCKNFATQPLHSSWVS